MINDLPSLLRGAAWYRRADGSDQLMRDAAGEIDRLRAEVDSLREIVRECDPDFDRDEHGDFLILEEAPLITSDQAERFAPVIQRAMEAPDER